MKTMQTYLNMLKDSVSHGEFTNEAFNGIIGLVKEEPALIERLLYVVEDPRSPVHMIEHAIDLLGECYPLENVTKEIRDSYDKKLFTVLFIVLSRETDELKKCAATTLVSLTPDFQTILINLLEKEYFPFSDPEVRDFVKLMRLHISNKFQESESELVEETDESRSIGDYTRYLENAGFLKDTRGYLLDMYNLDASDDDHIDYVHHALASKLTLEKELVEELFDVSLSSEYSSHFRAAALYILADNLPVNCEHRFLLAILITLDSGVTELVSTAVTAGLALPLSYQEILIDVMTDKVAAGKWPLKSKKVNGLIENYKRLRKEEDKNG